MMKRLRSMARVLTLTACALGLMTGNALAQSADERSGFTLLVDLGVGIQNDTGLEETAVGLGGINVGIGAFITPNLAIMGRFSGTYAEQDFGFASVNQASGVLAPIVQYWVNDRFNLRAGAGFGVWSADDESDRGLGVIVGFGATVFQRGKHSLQVGVEYAPAFTDPGTVHNFGFTFGYQLF